MRKLSVTFAAAAAVLLVSSLAWNADAQTSRGAANIPPESQDFSPIQQANCGGPGPYCPTGLVHAAVRTVAGAYPAGVDHYGWALRSWLWLARAVSLGLALS